MTAVVSRRVITARVPKKRINRSGCIARLHHLWQQERDLGHEPPAAERTANLDTLSDDDLVSLGKRVAARVQAYGQEQAEQAAEENEVVALVRAGQFAEARVAAQREHDSDGALRFIADAEWQEGDARARVQAAGTDGTLVGGEDEMGRFWWCDLDETPIAGPFPDERAAQVWAQRRVREVSPRPDATEQQGAKVVDTSPRTVRVTQECSGSQPQQLPPLDGYTWWYRSGVWYAATDLAPGTMVGRFRSEREARRACERHASERRRRRCELEDAAAPGRTEKASKGREEDNPTQGSG